MRPFSDWSAGYTHLFMNNSHTRLVSKTIGLLDSMIKSGEQHDETSVKMIGLSRAALHGLERQLEDLQNIVEKVAYSIEECKTDRGAVILGDKLERNILNA